MSLELHRQAGFTEPEVTLRHHRGDQGIDLEVTIPAKLARELVEMLPQGITPLIARLRAERPAFVASLPSASYPTIYDLFDDMRYLGSGQVQSA